MDLIGLMINLAVGAGLGWMAQKQVRTANPGLVGNIILGIIGALFARLLFRIMGIAPDGIIGTLSLAAAGAGLLILLVLYLDNEKNNAANPCRRSGKR
ncbi:MAG: GlsB/YeaQ/YmgE family stress response membrane protein [Proteobacteria bacterium]|nr:GlsB/YeaQ/YmgE family stress response membrane protein [Pseudomonadota bacterium]